MDKNITVFLMLIQLIEKFGRLKKTGKVAGENVPMC